jgi:ribosomal protein S18 acetylase RimI-like enzyme
MQTTTIEADGGAIEAFVVPWDSEIFGFPVAQISDVRIGAASTPDDLLRQFDDWCAERDVRLVSCRLEHTRLRESMTLEDLGFRFVEMVYEPHLDVLTDLVEPRHAITVAAAEASDIDAIEAIAGDAFTTGRFLLDWRLPAELSERRYARWVRRSFESDDQRVLKAGFDGELVGFFIVEGRPDGGVYWHLTAVAPGWQGRGIGLSLWRTMLIRHRDDGGTSVRTTISGHNPPAMNLYARLGFAFDAPQMTFHWLRDHGA